MWSEGSRFVQVSVYRTKRYIEGPLDILSLNIMPGADESTANDGYIGSPDRTDRIWVVEPGLVLRVMTSVSLKDDLDRIAEGLPVQHDVPAARVSHLPEPESLDDVGDRDLGGCTAGLHAR